jgi:fructokinase
MEVTMSDNFRAAAFGEILWDILPEKKCLGGAPLNCAGNLNRLGVQASIVSALGKDDLGNEAFSIIKKEHIATDYLQLLDAAETGYSRVVLKDGIPSYEFNFPCAWDLIELPDAAVQKFCAEHWNLFIFGSLAQRSETSRNTLRKLLSGIRADTVFFDVNIRKEFYNADIIRDSLGYTDILKMNDEEVPVLARIFDRTGSSDSEFINWLIKKYEMKGIIVTRGKEGPAAYFNGSVFEQQPSPVPVIDTVGAGDSFSAGFLSAFVRGKSVQTALNVGTTLADYVVSHNGALPEYDENLKALLAGLLG